MNRKRLRKIWKAVKFPALCVAGVLLLTSSIVAFDEWHSDKQFEPVGVARKVHARK